MLRQKTPTISVLTLGCKLNQADSEVIARRLAANGVRVLDRAVPGAAAFVINSCSVTHVADRKARHLVRMARRLSPNADIVLTGCYAETGPADIAEQTGADAVLPNAAKPWIPDRLLARLRERGDPSAGCPTFIRGDLRTRAFIKIQEGCNELCAFCIVPYTRGRETSVPIDRIVAEVRAREADGVQEVVLTGTQLGNYGRDTEEPEQGPRRLLEALLERTSVPRIRLSSLQAQDISPALLDLWTDLRLCPHFHLPLQSGSDPVLKRMRRRYPGDDYRRAVALVRGRVPDVAITTDVIAGFPGESTSDFEATIGLCREIGFAAIHAFPYSRRPHTSAALMRGHLSAPVRRARVETLLQLACESSLAFRRHFLDRTMQVLWEERRRGRWQGLTGNYIRVYSSDPGNLSNRLLPTQLAAVEDEGMAGLTGVLAGTL